MENKQPVKWYFRTSIIIIAFLCVGPFALPMVWLNPRFSRVMKALITVVALVLTYYLVVLLEHSLKNIVEYYQQALQTL